MPDTCGKTSAYVGFSSVGAEQRAGTCSDEQRQHTFLPSLHWVITHPAGLIAGNYARQAKQKYEQRAEHAHRKISGYLRETKARAKEMSKDRNTQRGILIWQQLSADLEYELKNETDDVPVPAANTLRWWLRP